MTGVVAWFREWANTVHIMIFRRDLYRELRRPIVFGELADFADVPRPGDRVILDQPYCDAELRLVEAIRNGEVDLNPGHD